MVNRKLNYYSSLTDQYWNAVENYLSGEPISSLSSACLPPHLKALLDARAKLAAGNTTQAIELLESFNIQRVHLENWIKGEFHFVLGNAHYDLRQFALASGHYQGAADFYRLDDFSARELLASFNMLQCLDELGQKDIAHKARMSLLAKAESRGAEQIRALCLRALADWSIHEGNFLEAMRLFKIAGAVLVRLGNLSDGIYSMLLSILCSLKVSGSNSLNADLDSIPASLPNHRCKSLAAFIYTISELQVDDRLLSAYRQCDSDAQDIIHRLRLLEHTPTNGGKRKPQAAQQRLIKHLRERNGATKEELIALLWPNDQASSYHLGQRLFTLISRTNRTRKAIFLDSKGIYRLY